MWASLVFEVVAAFANGIFISWWGIKNNVPMYARMSLVTSINFLFWLAWYGIVLK